MTLHLRDLGHRVNTQRVRRLLRQMGLEAFYPKPRLSIPDPLAGRYPYLLKGLESNRPDQVWCADITYLGLPDGFAYLVAIMDWFRRYVIRLGTFQFDGERLLRGHPGTSLWRRTGGRKFTTQTRAASSLARNG